MLPNNELFTLKTFIKIGQKLWIFSAIPPLSSATLLGCLLFVECWGKKFSPFWDSMDCLSIRSRYLGSPVFVLISIELILVPCSSFNPPWGILDTLKLESLESCKRFKIQRPHKEIHLMVSIRFLTNGMTSIDQHSGSTVVFFKILEVPIVHPTTTLAGTLSRFD